MRRLILAIFLLTSITAMSQSYLYKGRSNYQSDILYTWDGKHIYKGRSTYQSDIL